MPPENAADPILLVDDNPTNLQILYKTLKNVGHKLLVASSGEDALTIARQARPPLILLDILMPGIDGYETCRRLKADPVTADAAVIFLSALDGTEDKVKGLHAGAVDYIAKPFQSDEVIARVDTHLTLQRLKREMAERNQQLESNNRHILQAVAEGIYGLDPQGRIVFANPAACQLTGYAEAELLGQSLFRLHLYARWDGTPYPEKDCPAHATLALGEKTHSDTDVFWRQSGDHFPVEYSCAPIHRDGHVQGAVLAFQDITQRKRQERALRKALSEVHQLKEQLQAENAYLQEELRHQAGFGNIVGESRALKNVLSQVQQVAGTNSTVLVLGESGTGKEAIARAIHDHSARADRPLIKVNCGAISPNLIESELFGHEKGSFTGAIRQRTGHFELANGGTIFLDEVGELPADAQVKLLRVLQEQEFTRVGSEDPIRVDVRVIAATNRDLAAMVETGEFRMDLYYRLNVFPLRVPPLRERLEDIPLLAEKFLADQAAKLGKPLRQLDEDSQQRLQAYHWPGNIRELQNLIERAAILSDGPLVHIADGLIHSGIRAAPVDHNGGGTAAHGPADPGGFVTLAEAEAHYIRQVLDRTQWMIAGKGGAAEILDLPASTLRSRMKKLGIDKPTRSDPNTNSA